ncbi:cadherin-related family member 5-like isoform X2 [Paroedura picta]|uniref:cadherin-related family member 5-like isoform X2 n=1 Tax=Paroedura picta TaxID=143630 RepID=UPI0040560842
MPPLTCGVLLHAIYMTFHLITAVADQCSGGSNIFTEIPENSPFGTLVSYLTVFGDPESDAIQLRLSGTDAEWFYLDGKAVRLNVSEEKVLDREMLESPVLMFSFTCVEDGYLPVEYRIIVQVMNENDNRPQFQEDTILPQNISELAAVHSVLFSAQADDADGDTIMYVIDSSSADSRHFRIDLPNSGKIVLAKPLDFETQRHLEVVVHAVEMSTKERYNSSARIQVNVMDGDDQYPKFLPCNFLSHDGVSVCVSPVYTTNITEREMKTGPLLFLPGAIHAEDGDQELKAPISYSILAGTDHGCFHIDNVTGVITMLQPVESRLHTPVYSLSIMASQVNDPKKYAVTEVRVRVLAANSHPPHFGQAQYQAFTHQDVNAASLVVTYSARVLFLHAVDMDFPDGFNPLIRYSLKRQSNHSLLFQVTPGGLLIAHADHLHALERYALQVIARDEESGETASVAVHVEVLRPGQAVPMDPLELEHQGTLDPGALAGCLAVLLFVTAVILFFILRTMKKRQRHQQSMEREALAMEKHPNVVNPGKAVSSPGNIYFQNEGYCSLGDEMPKSYGGQGPNAKSPLVRSQTGLAAGDVLVANSLSKASVQQGAQAKAGLTSTEQEEGAKATLLNGKTLEKMSGSPINLEGGAFSKDFHPKQAARKTRVEAEVAEEPKEPLIPNTQASLEEKSPSGSGSQQAGQTGGGQSSRETESALGSPPASRVCAEVEGRGEHMDPSHPVPSAGPVTGTPETSGSLKREPNAPLPTLQEESKETEEEEEDDGEETPKAGSPTHQDPPTCLAVSNIRMPASLLQLLEDSIEC